MKNVAFDGFHSNYTSVLIIPNSDLLSAFIENIANPLKNSRPNRPRRKKTSQVSPQRTLGLKCKYNN